MNSLQIFMFAFALYYAGSYAADVNKSEDLGVKHVGDWLRDIAALREPLGSQETAEELDFGNENAGKEVEEKNSKDANASDKEKRVARLIAALGELIDLNEFDENEDLNENENLEEQNKNANATDEDLRRDIAALRAPLGSNETAEELDFGNDAEVAAVEQDNEENISDKEKRVKRLIAALGELIDLNEFDENEDLNENNKDLDEDSKDEDCFEYVD